MKVKGLKEQNRDPRKKISVAIEVEKWGWETKSHKNQRKISDSQVEKVKKKKKKLYSNLCKVHKKRIIQMEIEGLVGVLHEPSKLCKRENMGNGKFLYGTVSVRGRGYVLMSTKK